MKPLFLDDTRDAPVGWDCVRNYSEFKEYIKTNGVPDVISFDHDLALEHYPFGETSEHIPYASYSEKTGYHCAMHLIELGLIPKKVIVHSFNPVGGRNIANAFSPYTSVVIQPYRHV